MCFSKCWVDTHSRSGRFVSCSGAFGKRHHRKASQPIVIRSDSRVGHCIVGVECGSLVITNNRPREPVFSKCIPVKPPAQISLVSLRIVGASLGELLAFVASELRDQGLCNVG